MGALGALNRVYVNIGLFSEEWLLHFNPLVGGKPITPDHHRRPCDKNSSYWERHRSADAEHGAVPREGLGAAPAERTRPAAGSICTADPRTIERGKIVFAETCARCHSSKAPTPPAGADPGACAGKDYLACWDRLLGVDQDRRLQAADAADRPAPRTS